MSGKVSCSHIQSLQARIRETLAQEEGEMNAHEKRGVAFEKELKKLLKVAFVAGRKQWALMGVTPETLGS